MIQFMQKHWQLYLVSFFIVTFNTAVKAQEICEPEAATGIEEKHLVTGKKFMVVAANPYASQAGYDILAKGGSAVDAAIAVQMVLTLVEPQSSGIGGGAFILHWDEEKKKLITFDGRETAPSKADSTLFLNKEGKVVSWIDAVVGGRSVGVPGVLAALKLAHQQHGKLPWADLFEPAIKLAEHGFVVSPRLAKLVSLKFNPGIEKLPTIKEYFFPNGKAIQAGDKLINKPLAKALQSIAKEGVDVFYQGWLADKIVNQVQNSEIAPGLLSHDDLKKYKALAVPAVCGNYHEYRVCGMGPPSSGGITVIQTLGQLEPFNLQQFSPKDVKAAHLFTQSSKLAFADRNKYIADNSFVNVPINGLLSTAYLKQRSALINPLKDMGIAAAGQPINGLSYAKDNAYEMPSTSHISIIDANGNAISMTSSIEMGFGSALMVEGFILNNQLTDFSLQPEKLGKPIANSLAGGKKPRSSMAPMMVFNPDGTLKIVLGSPGGSRIINYVTKTIIAMLDWQLSPQQAVSLPNITNRNDNTTIEKGSNAELWAPILKSMGHKVSIRDLNSGLHVIEVKNEKLIGGADPRREGVVLAE